MEPPAFLLHKLVFELDKAADKILKRECGITYKRALFLGVLEKRGAITQHELADALGYSDPAVSSMLVELVRNEYVSIIISPEHKRKRLVSITQKGSKLNRKGLELINALYEELVRAAAVDAQKYDQMTKHLYQALRNKGHHE